MPLKVLNLGLTHLSDDFPIKHLNTNNNTAFRGLANYVFSFKMYYS